MKDRLYVGVDPGLQGAIALLPPGRELPQVWAMPVITKQRGKGKELDFIAFHASMAKLRKEYGNRVFIVFELAQPMPKQGGVSGFNYGRGYGMMLASAKSLMLSHTEVRPAIWKNLMLAGYPRPRKKEASIAECLKMFPFVNISKPRKGYHDGKAEALLLAAYGQRKGF